MVNADENIFCTSSLDRYASRPDELEYICLAEFVALYSTGARDSADEGVDHIPDVHDDGDDNSDREEEIADRYPSIIEMKHGLGLMRKRRQKV